jgi:allene oxide cyclase
MPNCLKLPSPLHLFVIVPVVSAGAIAASSAAYAEPQEIKLVEHATTDAVTDTGASGDSAGDILTFSNEVYDADDKNKVGSDQGICFRTVPGKAWSASGP